MIHILLMILKIILFVILGISGLALLLVLLVLIAPIRYKIDVSYYGKARIIANLRFLVVSLRVYFDQEKQQLTKCVRLFGIPIKERKPGKEKKQKKSKQNIDTICIEDEDNNSYSAGEQEDSGSTVSSEIQESCDSDTVSDTVSDTILPEKEKTWFGRVKVLIGRILDKIKSIKEFFIKLSPENIGIAIDNRLKGIKKLFHRIQIFWNMKCTVKTREYLKKYIPGVIKHISPGTIRGNIHFGFDEPYKTGRIIGYMSMLPAVYRKKLYWEPDFYNKVMEGELFVKGRIRLGYILRIVPNINIWKTIKAISKIKA